MKSVILTLSLVGAAVQAQAHDYLVYGVEVIHEGKTDFSSEVTIENGQPGPAAFSNLVSTQPQSKCKPNATINLNPVQTGYQMELAGNIWGDTRAAVAVSYIYRKGVIGEWVDTGTCRFQRPIDYLEFASPASPLNVGERVMLASHSTDVQDVGPKSYELYVTLKAIKRNVDSPMQTGFKVSR